MKKVPTFVTYGKALENYVIEIIPRSNRKLHDQGRKLHDLTPKGQRPFSGPFLKFEQAIVDAIFVQKISNFQRTCGLVLASRCSNFYKIPISSLGAMP
jgi:hypothetical protein